ncbi:MAG: hypothetical protein QMD09_13675 [Desulfatibacillaceae bacterium]|nr:hypothetical protein [Desulfatibacillaceae bacterium]
MRGKHILLITIALLLTAAPALALDNNVAHPNLTVRAVNLLVQQEPAYSYLSSYINFNLAAHTQLTFLDEGSVKEDYGFWADWNTSVWGSSQDPNVPYLSYQSHGFNPKTGVNWDPSPGGTTALVYSTTVWNKITSAYNPYFHMGRFAHLMEDMASPAHAHADLHVDGDDFETFGEYHYSTINFTPTTVRMPSTHGLPNDSSLPHPNGMTINSHQNFILNVVWRTYYMTSYWGGILVKRMGDRQPDSELKRMFPYWDGGLRYDNGGWFVNDHYKIDAVGYNWIGWGIGNNPDWWQCTNDAQYFYLENIDGNYWNSNPSQAGLGVAPHVFKVNKFTRIKPTTNLNTALAANNKIFTVLYGENLYPMSVEWIAGFLKYAEANR